MNYIPSWKVILIWTKWLILPTIFNIAISIPQMEVVSWTLARVRFLVYFPKSNSDDQTILPNLVVTPAKQKGKGLS